MASDGIDGIYGEEALAEFCDAIQERIVRARQADVVAEHELQKLMQITGAGSTGDTQKGIVAMLALVVSKKRRREDARRCVSMMHAELLEEYIKFRGGIQQVRVYTIPDVTFDIATFGEKECESWFRFSQEELRRLNAALRIPAVIVTAEGDKCDGFEVLCMLCLYYAYPCRRFEMIEKFGTGLSRLSRLISHLRAWLWEKYYPGMSKPALLSSEKIEEYANAVFQKCGVRGVFSFIDGTVQPTPKPELFQNLVYNGKDRTHALKYQMLCTPDGVMRHVSGPYCGSRHDQHMVHKSAVLDWVTAHPRSPHGYTYTTYADAGYAVAPGLMRPYPDDKINIEHAAFNDVMSSVRVCVEWEFGDIVVYWAAVNFKPQMKIASGSMPGQQYIVAALLSKCHNCLRPGKTQKYFSCPPPSLEQYVESLLQ